MWKRHSKTAIILLIVLTTAGITVLAQAQWPSPPPEGATSVAGFYLTNGGQSCLVIEPALFDRFKVKEGKVLTLSGLSPLMTDDSFTVALRQGHLFLRQNESMAGLHSAYQVFGRMVTSMELIPSQTVPGDWDLIEARFTDNHYPEPPAWLVQQVSICPLFEKWFWKLFNLLAPTTKETEMSMGKQNPPMQSFLHRIEDPNLPEYCQLRTRNRFGSDHMPLLRQIVSAHPEDPYLRVHEIELETLYGDIEAARRLVGEWIERLEKAPDLLLRDSAQRAIYRFESAVGPEKDLEPEKLVRLFAEEKINLDGFVSRLRTLWDLNHLVINNRPVMGARPSDLSPPGLEPVDYLSVQILARVIAVLAELDLFQGSLEESLGKMASVYTLGDILCVEGQSTEGLIGIAIRLIANSRLDLIVLNASDDPLDLEKEWVVLERLNSLSRQVQDEDPTMARWSNFLKGLPVRVDNDDLSEEVINRFQSAALRLQLTRMALAARHHFLTTGTFPRSSSDFAPFFKEDLPKDPYSNTPLRFTKPGFEPFAVYSVGPDRVDNFGQIEYGPTNGTTSAGDSILNLPKERKYPFPQGGAHARSAEDVLRQFPNGLPLDPFAGNGNTPLSILDATREVPVRIFSFGPEGVGSVTNGKVSNVKAYSLPGLKPVDIVNHPMGDYQLVFSPCVASMTSGESTMATTTTLNVMGEGNLSDEEMIKKMKESMDKFQSRIPVRPFQLGPHYDPTNGIRSTGQLYIELPE